MKFLNILLIFFLLTTSLLANQNKDLEKAFNEYKKNIERIHSKIKKLKTSNLKEAKIIDESIKEIQTLTEYSLKNLDITKQDNLINSLKAIDAYLNDISKFVPQEFSREAPNTQANSVDEKSIKKMATFASTMKSKKNNKKKDLIKTYNALEKKGFDISKTNEKLNSIKKVSLVDTEKRLENIFEKPEFISKEVNETRLSDFATARVLQKFDFSWEKNNFRISVGKPVDEALGVKKTVFDEAIKFGFSKDKANLISNNAYYAYYDMYFHADEVSEKVRAAGGSWEEADKALENWLLDDKNRYKEWALNLYDLNDLEEDKYLPDPKALKDWFNRIGNNEVKVYQISNDRIEKEAMARTIDYLTQDFIDGQKAAAESDPYKEADEVFNFVKEMAIEKGFSKDEAEIISENAKSKYLDIWLDATLEMEKVLASGKGYDIADKAVEKWAITNENKYGKWFEAWGEPENPNKDWIPNKENFGKYLDDLKGKTIERVEISDTRKDIEISMKVYENINYNNKLQQWEGDVFKEANEVADAFYNRALNDLELSQSEANKIKQNVYNTYVDTWYEGTYVSEEVRYRGGSWEDADKAVESWFQKSNYKDFWVKNEKNYGIKIEEDDLGKITVIVQPIEGIYQAPKPMLKSKEPKEPQKPKVDDVKKEVVDTDTGIDKGDLDIGIDKGDLEQVQKSLPDGNTFAEIQGEIKELNIYGEVMANSEVLSAAQEAARDAAAAAGQAKAAASAAAAPQGDPSEFPNQAANGKASDTPHQASNDD